MLRILLVFLLSISLAHAAETDKTADAIKDTLQRTIRSSSDRSIR